MQTFIVLLFKSVLISALLFLYYQLVLKGKKLHHFNRFYLLLVVPVSLILPQLHFQWYTISEAPSATAIHILQAISATGENEVATGGPVTRFKAQSFAWIAYGLISMTLLILTLSKILWIYKLKKSNKVVKMPGYDLVYTDLGKAPFSFFNTLFWRDTIAAETESGKQILQHELTHIKQHHSLDKLFLQSAVIFFWVNPIYWLIQKELSLVHEFIADESAVKDQDTESFAMMLLQSHYGNISPYLVNPFFSSSVKKRLFMISQTNKTKYSQLRRYMILPLLAGAAILCSCTITRTDMPGNKANHRMLMVLDAGHGGNDAGATGLGGVAEKDLTLQICNKMSQLAGEYNIDVMQTRPDDNYVTLNARADKANATNAGIMISIHVNKATPDNPVSDGYEVIVSEQNREIENSKVLASTVISGMQQLGVKPVFVNKGIHVLKAGRMPAIAIECGRVDNAEELAMVQDNAKLELFCRNILSSVVAYQNNTHKTIH